VQNHPAPLSTLTRSGQDLGTRKRRIRHFRLIGDTQNYTWNESDAEMSAGPVSLGACTWTTTFGIPSSLHARSQPAESGHIEADLLQHAGNADACT